MNSLKVNTSTQSLTPAVSLSAQVSKSEKPAFYGSIQPDAINLSYEAKNMSGLQGLLKKMASVSQLPLTEIVIQEKGFLGSIPITFKAGDKSYLLMLASRPENIIKELPKNVRTCIHR